MARNIVVLLDNADGRAMVKEAYKKNGLGVSGFEVLAQRTEKRQADLTDDE